MKKGTIVLSIITLICVSILALPASGAKTVLRKNLGTEPPTLDPALSTDTASIAVVEQLFLGLTDFDDETMEVIPELAKDWWASDDGLAWTFVMRDDVKWTNGKPVTAYDVEYGVKRTLNPATASDYAYVLYIIKGAQDYNTGKVEDASTVSVKAVGDYIVRFELNHAAGYFPAIAGMWIARPQPKEVIEKWGDKWTEPENIVTNAHYILKEWVHDDYLVLVKNPDSYEADKVQIDEIYAVMIEEQSTALALYEGGELDVVHDVPLEDMDRLKTDPILSKELYIAPRLCTYYYGFNNEKFPFDNPLVRKAFASAIDRQTLITTILKGEQRPATTFSCPGIFGWVDPAEEIGHPFNVEKAREFLAQAGYPGGEGFPVVTLMFNTSESHRKIAQVIQAMWQQVLEIKVNLANQEWKVYLKTCVEDAPQIYRLGWCADYPDANNWLNDVFNSKSESNYANFSNPEFDKLVEAAARESDPAKRKEMYQKAERILCDTDAAITPIYWYTRVVMTKPYVERTYAPMGGEHIKDWKILPH